jgi:5-methylcytosine-specific restriction endonuclease McrA
MPCYYKQYAENWRWLSKQTISDAGNKCELCFAPNGELIYRDPDSGHPWDLAENLQNHEYKNKKLTRIVLTVHHIDGIKKNNSKQNLIALCQKCHLRLDLERHMKNRRERRIKETANIEDNVCTVHKLVLRDAVL